MFQPYEPPKKKGTEEAKGNLQQLMEARKFTKACTAIQSLLRSYNAKDVVSELAIIKAQSKISDIKKLKMMLGDKLKVLPLKNLKELINLAIMTKNWELFLELKDWIDASYNCQQPDFNIFGSKNNWNLIVNVGVWFAKAFKNEESAGKYILAFFEAPRFEIPSFHMFLLYSQLVCDENLLKSCKKHLEIKTLLASDNKITKDIQILLHLTFLSNLLYYQINIEELSSSDRSLVYDHFVDIQGYIVEHILSMPRMSKFILQDPYSNSVKWKEMIQSYYYGQLLTRNTLGYDEKEIYLFANLWELFSAKLFSSMSPSEMAPLLMTCAKAVTKLTPRLLESDSSACISEPTNLKVLRKQLSIFTDPNKLSSIFLKVFDHEHDEFTDQFNPSVAQDLCQIYNTFLEKCQTSKEAQFVVTGIMGGIAFNKKVLYRIWKFIQLFCDINVFLNPNNLASTNRNHEFYKFSPALSLFCFSYHSLLLIVDDAEFPYIFDEGELIYFTDFIIQLVHTGLLHQDLNTVAENLVSSACKILKLLHEFNSSKHFFQEIQFQLPHSQLNELIEKMKTEDPTILSPIIQKFPFCLPFTVRAEILSMNIAQTKEMYMAAPSTRIVVRRENLMIDSIAQIINVPDIRGKLEVIFVNALGTVEEGIDAGGLFKEYWTSLSAEAFNPQYGLFSVTSDQCLYPNPASELFFGKEHLGMFFLVGRILGKAIYERITVEPKFAEFFLRKMVGKYNFLEDLKSLDKEVYQNLKFLKNYQGNAEDLSLNFVVTNVDGSEVELIPKGSEKSVTNDNKLQYIYKLADYRLNIQIKDQCTAIFKGLSELISPGWLSMFTPSEMQIIISGTTEKIDIEDLKAYTRYIDCSHRDSFVKYFWQALESFSPEELSLLLRFVTSCPRPPLFGFKNLYPPFTISKVPIDRDDEKLPTAQTCVNTLRLPTYTSVKRTKEKLLYSIKSNSGFEFR